MSEIEESTASESSVTYDYNKGYRSETPSESSYEEGERQPEVDQEAMRQVVDVLCDNAPDHLAHVLYVVDSRTEVRIQYKILKHNYYRRCDRLAHMHNNRNWFFNEYQNRLVQFDRQISPDSPPDGPRYLNNELKDILWDIRNHVEDLKQEIDDVQWQADRLMAQMNLMVPLITATDDNFVEALKIYYEARSAMGY